MCPSQKKTAIASSRTSPSRFTPVQRKERNPYRGRLMNPGLKQRLEAHVFTQHSGNGQTNLRELEASQPALHREFEDSRDYIVETLSQKTNSQPLPPSSRALCCSFSLGSSLLTSSSTTSYICYSCPGDAQNRDRSKQTFISGVTRSGTRPEQGPKSLCSRPHNRGQSGRSGRGSGPRKEAGVGKPTAKN